VPGPSQGLRARVGLSPKIAAKKAARDVFHRQRGHAGHFLKLREANAPAVRLVSAVRATVPKVIVRSVPVLQVIGRPGIAPSVNAARGIVPKAIVPSEPAPREIGRPVNAARATAPKVTVPSVRAPKVTARFASGARVIGHVAQDRHGMAHSVIRVNPVVGRQVVAAIVIFLRQKRAPVIALPKLWRVRGFVHGAMRKRGFLKAA